MEIFQIIVTLVIGISQVVLTILAFRFSNNFQKQQVALAKQNASIAHDKMQMELHTKFSDEFEELLPNLLILFDSESPKNKTAYGEEQEAINTLTIRKYFNLCAEEFYWYKKGRIDKEVWNSWREGMNDFYSMSPLMQELWEDNSKDGGYKAYYLNGPTDLFDVVKKIL
ncbi:hypothetical protein DCS32_00070 [Dokdonia sp. Dokd-P16]|uniref:hypothetical protein n=1 Tax=Dokdonia sp. Dokd-P16 TaxID=2173169 RepID=UPI000D549A41|nr:hypothetical protein [Dokdonia sp. Dokd-P16]AWH72623.1 hypothetical protein DCS32_00070 [Dokdonia sp. Dokd-P16]